MCPNMFDDGQSGNAALSELAGYDVLSQDAYKIKPLAEIERAYIELAIKLCAGNIPCAAARLRVSPSTIYRKKASWENGGA